MVPLPVDDVAPFEDWPAAARAALAFLHGTVGMDVWMVTRVEGDEQVVVHSHPSELAPPGLSVPWDQSFCHRMVSGIGPRVATVTAATPAYTALMSGFAERVAAYIGVPLVTPAGTVFGTLCAVSSRAQPRSTTRFLPLVELTARLLSTLMAAEQGDLRDRMPVPETPEEVPPDTVLSEHPLTRSASAGDDPTQRPETSSSTAIRREPT
jgi:GAF domain-containing protein